MILCSERSRSTRCYLRVLYKGPKPHPPGPSIGRRMVDGLHQGWPEQLCRPGPAALDRLACFYYYYYYCIFGRDLAWAVTILNLRFFCVRGELHE